jgi:glutathione peroxidase
MEKQNIYQSRLKIYQVIHLILHFKRKKVMIVNTASKCGLTPQYKDLEAIYKEYKDQNFVIIGFRLIILDRKNRELMKRLFFCQQNYGVTSHDGQSIRKRR